jgi:GH18 family chitinase
LGTHDQQNNNKIKLNFVVETPLFQASNPGTKYLLALGGWTDSLGTKYSTLLASSAKISNFVSQAVTFISQNGFDGLDLDYEYPSSADKANFAALVAALRAAFTPRGWQLTAAVSARLGIASNTPYTILQCQPLIDIIPDVY